MRPDREIERALVERVCANDDAAVETLLFEVCGKKISYIACRFSLEPEELFVEIYLHLREGNWRRLRTWRGESSIRAWMSEVALNYCLRRVQDRQRLVPLSNGADEAVNSSIWGLANNEITRGVEDRVILLQAIELVNNARYRLILYWMLDGRDDIAQMASELQTTINEVYVLRSRALRSLRRVLEELDVDDQPS